ncbi:MAG: serine--tRNA ligase [Patescibacteria group bacterium]
MLDVNFIRENTEEAKKILGKKSVDPKLVDKFLRFDTEWRTKTAALDQLKSEQNAVSKELGKTQSEDLLSKAQILKKRVVEISTEREELEKKREEIFRKFPNPPLDEVPVCPDESGNKVLREVGEIPKFDFQPKDYLELGEVLGFINVKKAGEVSGSRFGYLMGDVALIEFALIKLAMDTLTPHGFVPVIPPVFVKEKTMQAMGYVDRREDMEETYFFEKDGLYLVGTSEQSVGPFHMGDVLNEEELPKRYVSFSTCFRREAGSYGKDTRGILRVHQFDKIEMFSFCKPEDSQSEHEFLLSLEEKLMQLLKLPYRVIQMCSGDLGNVAAAKYDIEAWFPSQNTYRETHSTSNCTDFQARRLNIKYRPKEKGEKPKFIHTLNGTAFSQRPILAIMENYQTKEGTIRVPEILQPYIGKKEIGK